MLSLSPRGLSITSRHRRLISWQAKQGTVLDGLYGNLAHDARGVGPVLGIPSDLKLYDPRYPNGYTFTAKIAIPAPVPTGGFFRVGLMYHLSNPATGENLFVEFDAYD